MGSAGAAGSRRPRQGPPPAVLAAALRDAAGLRRRAQVLGLAIAMRRRAGAWVEGEACIAIRVVEKIGPDRLPPRRALPAFLEVSHGGRRWRVPTDVRTANGATTGRCYGHVARPIQLQGAAAILGGVSACVITTSEPKLLISGHVARRAGRRMVADGVSLVTEEPLLSSRLDHCLARAELDLANASLPSGVRLAGIRDRATVRAGEPLFVARALDGSVRQVVVRDTEADAPFDYPSGPVRVQGLIGVDAVCEKGDSGCPLFDTQHRLVGTLLGGLCEDYYLPADYAFQQLGIALPD